MPEQTDPAAELAKCEAAMAAKDQVIANCERMLRFAPPPKHLAESNQWQQAIQDAQNELMMGRPGQQAVDEMAKLRAELIALRQQLGEARARLLTAAGDDLCRLSQEEIKAMSLGTVKIPPKEEFLASCERFHAQVAGEVGVMSNCLTLAQLVAENERLRSERNARQQTVEILRTENVNLRHGHSPFEDSVHKSELDELRQRAEQLAQRSGVDVPRWFIGKPSKCGRYFMSDKPEDWDINKCVGVQRIEYYDHGKPVVEFQAKIGNAPWVNVETLAGCIWYGPLLAPHLTQEDVKALRAALPAEGGGA